MANQPGQGMFSESRGGLKVSSLTFVKPSEQTKRAVPHHQGKSRFHLTRGPPGTPQWFHKMHSYGILRRVWSGIQNTLEESRSDVLILLDCCASGVCTSDEGNGVTELIAACTYNSVANGVGRYSFSHVLNDKLKQLSQLPCYNIGHLYNAMYSEVQSWRVEDSRFLKVPIHLVLSQNHDLPRSIRLSKARPAEHLGVVHAEDPRPSPSSAENPASNVELSDSSEYSRPSLLSSPNTSLSQLAEYPRLLFSIRLSEDVKPCDFSSELFADWLRCIPVSARLVTVEAGFASGSTITLVSVPAALLAYLAPDPAILLLGSIRSGNLVSEHQREGDAVPSESPVPTHNTATMNTRTAQRKGITTGIPRMATGFQSPIFSSSVFRGGRDAFSEVEMRFVLAEIAKKSTIPVQKMFEFFKDENILPDWEHILLPTGRDLSQCKIAWDSIRGLPSSQLPPPPPPPQSFLSQPPFPGAPNKRQSINPTSGPDSKRRKFGIETPTARDILPKPGSGSPLTMTSPPPATSNQKKRGRPSKSDVGRKQREAIERGDIIPPDPAAASPAGLQGQEEVRFGGFAPIMIAPVPARSPQVAMTPGHVLSPQMRMEQVPPVTMSADTAKKRRARPPPKPKVPKPGESQFSIHPPIGQSGQGENPSTPASTETAQAGPIAAPVEEASSAGLERYALPLTGPLPVQESRSGPERSTGAGKESSQAEGLQGEGSVAGRTRSSRRRPS